MILFTQVVIGAGLNNFFAYENEDTKGYTLIGLSFGFFIIMLIVGEIVYQCNMFKHVPLKEIDTVMTPKEFESRVEKGELLVILDDLVLDCSKFVAYHPGGKFVLQHNTGRDISKFFYGGYCLEGNIGA